MSHREMERTLDELATAEVEYRHAVAECRTGQRRSLAFELTTRRLEVDQQQLLVDNLASAARMTWWFAHRSLEWWVTWPSNSAPMWPPMSRLLTVIDLTALEVETDIPNRMPIPLAIGMAAEINYGNTTYPGLVAAISPEVNNAQVATRIRFADQAPPELRQNQRFLVRIVLDSREDVLTVQAWTLSRIGFGSNGLSH